MLDPLEDGPRAVQLLGHYVDDVTREMYEAYAECNAQEDAAICLPAEVSKMGVILPDEIIEKLRGYASLTEPIWDYHAGVARETLVEQERLRAGV